MKHAGPLAWVAMAVMAGWACTPQRDNPFDPQNAPVAALKVLDLTVDPSGGTSVAVAPRGHTLALDAAGSSDPRCNPAAAGCADYSFRVLVVGSASAGCGSTTLAAVSTNAALALIPYCFLHTAVPNQPLTFQVTITDRSLKGFSKVTSFVVPLNTAPVAVIDPALSLPVGGYPWLNLSSADTVAVVVHGEQSFDAEDPALSYNWTVVVASNGFVTSSAFPNAASDLSLRVPVVAARVTVTLVVNDGTVNSLPSSTTVDVGDAPLWVAGNGLDVENLDPLASDSTVPISGGSPSAAFIPATPGTPSAMGVGWFYEPTQSGVFAATAYPPPTSIPFAGTISFGNDNIPSVASDPPRNRFWVLTQNGSAHVADVHEIEVDPQTLVPTQPRTPAFLGFLPSEIQPLFAVPADGSFWVAGFGTGTVWRAATNSTAVVFTEPISDAGVSVTGIAARPAGPASSGEVWLEQVPAFVSTTSASTGASLVKFASDGTSTTFSIGHPGAVGLAWANHDELWLVLDDLGLVRLDASALEGGGTFDQNLLDQFPQVIAADATRLAGDPSTGEVWATAFPFAPDQVIYRARPGAVQTISAPLGTPQVQFIDDLGLVGSTLGAPSVRVGETISDLGLFASFPDDILTSDSGYDITNGGVWTEITGIPGQPNLLLHHSRDGARLETVAQVLRNGDANALIPPLGLFRVSPDATAAYAVVLNAPGQATVSLDRFALTSPFAETTILNATTAGEIAPVVGSIILEPSAPIPGSTPFLWELRSDSTALVTQPADGSGTAATVFTLPANETPNAPTGTANGALSLATNKLCFATQDITSNNVVHIRRVAPNGTLEDFGTRTRVGVNPSLGGGLSVSTFSGSGIDLCAVAISQNIDAGTTHLVVFENTIAAPLLDADITGDVSSMQLISPTELWVTNNIPNASNVVQLLRQKETFSGGAVTGTLTYDATNTAGGHLVGPSGRPANL